MTSDIIRSLLNSSMGNCAIHCESLSKRYRIGERPTNSLREALMNRLAAPLRRSHKGANGNDWTSGLCATFPSRSARGEVVGIIGRNGAGKSTLLKVLSRITEPTQGFAEVRGRVGSLLEVGTGFHPELTGRENIYLNGAILGMRKAEIARKFDEIVAFAEIEKFIDTPVKRYSSGMYVRLAFAVAAHLEPEILLVDEVLAVGDAQFQKKCFEKMRAVGQSGRTILFVSHNMAALRQVCQRGIVLESGSVVADGEINDVADQYLASVQMARATELQAETPTCILQRCTDPVPQQPGDQNFRPGRGTGTVYGEDGDARPGHLRFVPDTGQPADCGRGVQGHGRHLRRWRQENRWKWAS